MNTAVDIPMSAPNPPFSFLALIIFLTIIFLLAFLEIQRDDISN